MESFSIITEWTLQTGMPNARPEDVSDFVAPLNAAFREYGITTPVRQAACLGQFAEESDQLWHLRDHYGTKRGEEYADGKLYDGRKDLGNIHPNDGPRYKGRSLAQLTGLFNYLKYGGLLGVNLVANPDALLDPTLSCRAGGVYWQTHGCNELADQNTLDAFTAITKKINGGTNGIDKRIVFWGAFKRALAI